MPMPDFAGLQPGEIPNRDACARGQTTEARGLVLLIAGLVKWTTRSSALSDQPLDCKAQAQSMHWLEDNQGDTPLLIHALDRLSRRYDGGRPC